MDEHPLLLVEVLQSKKTMLSPFTFVQEGSVYIPKDHINRSASDYIGEKGLLRSIYCRFVLATRKESRVNFLVRFND